MCLLKSYFWFFSSYVPSIFRLSPNLTLRYISCCLHWVTMGILGMAFAMLLPWHKLQRTRSLVDLLEFVIRPQLDLCKKLFTLLNTMPRIIIKGGVWRNTEVSSISSAKNCAILGLCRRLESLIQDQWHHIASKETISPGSEWNRRFLWCSMIRIILDYLDSGHGTSEKIMHSKPCIYM